MARNETIICKPSALEGDFYVKRIDHDGKIPDGYELWYCDVKVLWIDNPFALEMAKAIIEAEKESEEE